MEANLIFRSILLNFFWKKTYFRLIMMNLYFYINNYYLYYYFSLDLINIYNLVIPIAIFENYYLVVNYCNSVFYFLKIYNFLYFISNFHYIYLRLFFKHKELNHFLIYVINLCY